MDLESEQLPIPTEEPAGEDLESAKPLSESPALVIQIQSWATPIVGLLMLLLGLGLGYFGRPLITQRTSANPPAVSANATPDASTEGANSASSSENAASLMKFLTGETRHFEGDPNAPVTMIEFSDFQ